MLLQVTPTDPPILVERVESIDRDGEPCWLVIGQERVVRRNCSGLVPERVSYVVPKTYRGMREVAA